MIYLLQHAASLRPWEGPARCSVCAYRVRQHVTDFVMRECRHASVSISLDALTSPEGKLVELPDDGPSPYDPAVAGLQGCLLDEVADESLCAALRRLAPDRLAVLDMCVGRNMTCEQAATALGISRNAALHRRARALADLRRILTANAEVPRVGRRGPREPRGGGVL